MARKTGLGRGFESLIPTNVLDETFDPTASQDEQVSELRHLKTSEVFADPDQPRRHFDEDGLSELTASIKEHGIIQPIVVTRANAGYQIVAGERRWRAATILKLDKIPALIRTLTAQHKLELALIENLQRRDLNPLETATAYLKLHEQFNLTYEEIGVRVGGKAVSTISNILRLLQLPETAKQALINGEISEGHARQILALPDENAQNDLLKHIVSEGWSVRKAEQFVVGYKQGNVEKPTAAVAKTQSETPLTQALAKSLSTKVSLKSTAKGGQLIIRYNDDDHLQQISNRLLLDN
jgi:ParB family chromosome partitioning protein